MAPDPSVEPVRRFPWWLLLLPLLVAAGVSLLSRACQPFWLGGSSDPSYPYLGNALLLAEARVPTMTQHPGTGLQLLGALVLRVLHALSGSQDTLRLHVLREPELFLSAFQGVLAGLNFFALTFLGWAAWRLTGRPACAVAAQAAPLAAAAYTHSCILVMCEPLLSALGVTLSGFLLLLMLQPARQCRAAHALGAVAGLSLATKLTAVPLVALPLAFIETRSARMRYVATTCGVLALALLVVLPRLPGTLAWFAGLATHPGLYAGGPAGAVLDRSSVAALGHVVARDWLLVALVAAFAGAGLLRAHGPQALRERRGLLVLVLIEVVGLLAAARQGALAHYVVPLAAPASVGLVLAHRVFSRGRRGRWPGLALWSVVVLVLANQAWLAADLLSSRANVVPGARAALARAARIGADRLFIADRASHPAAALSYANDWAGGAFGAELRALYPGLILYDEAHLHAFNRPIEARELRRYVTQDGTYRFWTSSFVPLICCRWFIDPRQEPGPRLGRDRLVQVAAEPPSAPDGAVLPPFVGFVALEGLGRYSLPAPPPAGALWGAGPRTRLAFMGPGRATWLLVDYELVAGQDQALTFRLNGKVLMRRQLSARDRRVVEQVPLAASTGPNEISVDYSQLLPPPAPDRSRPPTDAIFVPTGVLFHALRVVALQPS